MLKKKNETTALVSSLFLASSVLIFHVVLLAAMGILVIFFSGIVNYIFWIFLGSCALIGGGVYLFFRYMKKDGGQMVYQLMSLPELKGKNFEVKLLGGLASLKIAGDDDQTGAIDVNSLPASRQLEDPQSIRLRELTELARLMEKNLITAEEYDQAKKSLLHNG
ncbi:MAG: hypothetical protein WA081_04585 [Desulfosalsimonadaceae bacterium]